MISHSALVCVAASLCVCSAATSSPPDATPQPATGDGRTPASQPLTGLKQGDVAPEFEVPGLNGGKVRLADYRGRHVLLDFWATWCGSCVADMPGLRKLHERYGEDKRFALISLSLDSTIEEARTYVAANELTWTHGFVGPQKQSTIPSRYGVRGIPHMVLIDPDGRIVKPDLSYESARAALAELFPPEAESELEKAEIRGTVVLPDGRPAEAARVYQCVGTAHLEFKDYVPRPADGIPPSDRYPRRQVHEQLTDSSGAFQFEVPEDTYSIVVIHEAGFAHRSEIALRREPAIRLSPWARIEGDVTMMAPSLTVYLMTRSLDADEIYFHQYATPDADGRFVFERAAPGGLAKLRVTHGVKSRNEYHVPYFKVEPDRTITASLGSGRTLKGVVGLPKAVWDSWKSQGDGHSFVTHQRLELHRELPIPPEIKSDAAKRRWYESWMNSPEGRQPTGHITEIGKDGAFAYKDVPPGRYRLYCDWFGGMKIGGPPPARREFRSDVFEVPAVRADADDADIELGTVEMHEVERGAPLEGAGENSELHNRAS